VSVHTAVDALVRALGGSHPQSAPGPVAAGRPPLRRLADAAVRRAAQSAASGRMADGELRETLGRLCVAAHERGLHAEHLLILLKEAWYSLPEARRAPRTDTDDVLARVITLCVDEYYTPHHE
jgi:hypothetical protein